MVIVCTHIVLAEKIADYLYFVAFYCFACTHLPQWFYVSYNRHSFEWLRHVDRCTQCYITAITTSVHKQRIEQWFDKARLAYIISKKVLPSMVFYGQMLSAFHAESILAMISLILTLDVVC